MIAYVVKITSSVARPLAGNFTSCFNLKWFDKRLAPEWLKSPMTIIPQLFNLGSTANKLSNRLAVKFCWTNSTLIIYDRQKYAYKTREGIFACLKHYVNHIVYLLEVKTAGSVETRIAVLGPVLFQTFRKVVWKKGEHQLHGTYIEPCSHNTTEKTVISKVIKVGQFCLLL